MGLVLSRYICLSQILCTSSWWLCVKNLENIKNYRLFNKISAIQAKKTPANSCHCSNHVFIPHFWQIHPPLQIDWFFTIIIIIIACFTYAGFTYQNNHHDLFLREARCYQNGWIFRKVPNGLWRPARQYNLLSTICSI